MMDISEFLMYLMGEGPALALWIVVIIFAVIMLRRGGGRAERFLVAGAGLKIISNLLIIPTFAIVPWLFYGGYSTTYTQSVIFGYGIFCKVVGMAGIICLVYAFWVRFRVGNLEAVESVNKEPAKEVAPQQ